MSVQPTGRQRFRLEKRLFRQPLVVLQIEFAGEEVEFTCGIVGHVKVRYWRDATVENLTVNDQAAQSQ